MSPTEEAVIALFRKLQREFTLPCDKARCGARTTTAAPGGAAVAGSAIRMGTPAYCPAPRGTLSPGGRPIRPASDRLRLAGGLRHYGRA